MGKLRVLSGREACKILEAEGFSEVRRRGSHVVMGVAELPFDYSANMS